MEGNSFVHGVSIRWQGVSGTAVGRGFVGRKHGCVLIQSYQKCLPCSQTPQIPSEVATDDGNPITGVLLFWREFSGKFESPPS